MIYEDNNPTESLLDGDFSCETTEERDMMEIYLATDKDGFQAVYMHKPVRHTDGFWFDPIMDFVGELPDDLSEDEKSQKWEDEPILLTYTI